MFLHRPLSFPYFPESIPADPEIQIRPQLSKYQKTWIPPVPYTFPPTFSYATKKPGRQNTLPVSGNFGCFRIYTENLKSPKKNILNPENSGYAYFRNGDSHQYCYEACGKIYLVALDSVGILKVCTLGSDMKVKAVSTEDVFVSHSFGEYVKFKDGNLYLLNLGDGIPRAVFLTAINNYGTKKEEANYYHVLKLKGAIGNNATGCSIGGMEIGNKNILTVGAEQPHGYKIKGIKGFSSNYKDNIYVAVTDKTTGKNTLKWLTAYHPKNKYISFNAKNGKTQRQPLCNPLFHYHIRINERRSPLYNNRRKWKEKIFQNV